MSAAVAYRAEPEQIVSGVMAVGVHAAFLALLVFGVTWQHKAPAPVMVELWSALPQAPASKPPEPAAKPEPEVKPPPPPPPPPEVKAPPPKPVPVAKPEPAPKADIVLKEKADAEKRKKEEQARLDEKKALEKRKADDTAKAEAKRVEDERQRVAAIQADAAAKEAEKQRLAKEQADALRRAQDKALADAAKEKSEHMGRIRDRIRRFITLPPDMQGNPTAEFDIVVLPTGDVLHAKLKRPSGNAAYDAAVERAIVRAQPLPVPKGELFKEFRELNLQFRPND